MDFENILRPVEERVGSEVGTDETVRILGGLIRAIEDAGRGASSIRVRRAYADWESMEEGLQANLSLMNIKPQYVLAKTGKSSADLALSLDLLETLLTRPEVDAFVIVGGDRDYIPIVSRVMEKGKDIFIASLPGSVSGDLQDIVGKDRFIDMTSLLMPASGLLLALPSALIGTGESGREAVAPRGPVMPRHPRGRRIDPGAKENREPRPMPPSSVAFPESADQEAIKIRAIQLLHRATQQFGPEIYLVPFFKNFMNDAMPEFNLHQRKAIINRLGEEGVLRVETKQSAHGPYNYTSVFLIYEHPMVQRAVPGASAPPEPADSAAAQAAGLSAADPESAAADGAGAGRRGYQDWASEA
ncbi:MAG TPA: NYN domain-containing protein [Acidobacteriota bacterium]